MVSKAVQDALKTHLDCIKEHISDEKTTDVSLQATLGLGQTESEKGWA